MTDSSSASYERRALVVRTIRRSVLSVVHARSTSDSGIDWVAIVKPAATAACISSAMH